MKDNPRPNYFEGVLQLRNPNDVILNHIYQMIEKKENVFIAKIVDIRNGLDIYLSSQRYLQTLARSLVHRYGGTLKVSAKLFTRDRTGKDLYRVNVFYEVPEFMQGEIVAYRRGIGKVRKIGKKECIIYNFLSCGNVSVPLHDLEKTELFKTSVSKVRPVLEVLHPFTYQSVPVTNKVEKKTGEKVKVVVWKEAIFVIN